MALCPGLKIYTPDYFHSAQQRAGERRQLWFDQCPINYGHSIDALMLLITSYPACNLNGPGTNYVFWDSHDPTAKLHEIMADVAQQIISPVQIGKLTPLNGSNRLDLVNIPVGLNGFVEGSTNLALGKLDGRDKLQQHQFDAINLCQCVAASRLPFRRVRAVQAVAVRLIQAAALGTNTVPCPSRGAILPAAAFLTLGRGRDLCRIELRR